MLLVAPVHSRRVLVLGAAGLVPAALVTLLLVHQPSIGDRRLYPMLRGSLALVGLGLALATVITWATASDRLSRTSLSGLAWAGVTMMLCIGPLLESTPARPPLRLGLETGDVVWDERAGPAPRLVDGDLVVTDVRSRAVIGLDPASGQERWRDPIESGEPSVGRPTTPTDGGIQERRRPRRGIGSTGSRAVVDWRCFPGEQVLAVTQSGNSVYVYVCTAGRGRRRAAGAIVKIDAESGDIQWRGALPAAVAVGDRQRRHRGQRETSWSLPVASGSRCSTPTTGGCAGPQSVVDAGQEPRLRPAWGGTAGRGQRRPSCSCRPRLTMTDGRRRG